VPRLWPTAVGQKQAFIRHKKKQSGNAMFAGVAISLTWHIYR